MWPDEEKFEQTHRGLTLTNDGKCQIHIVNFDFYSMEAFNRCENSNDVLLAIPSWANVHPLKKKTVMPF